LSKFEVDFNMAKKNLATKENPLNKKAIRQKRQAKRKRQRYLRVSLLVIGIALVAGYFLWPRPQAQAVSQDRLQDDPALGPPTAAVTIVEYGDFGCPSCRGWHNAGILERVQAAYGDQVRFVWRDFPVITAQSPKAAEAAQCAYDQGLFWEYHDLLFERAHSLYAGEIGLDTEIFNQCLDSGQHRATVENDLQDAIRRRFRGTPSFLVNDQALAGPPTFEYLQSLIDPILLSGN
jgi:protein-disulfide isomerase